MTSGPEHAEAKEILDLIAEDCYALGRPSNLILTELCGVIHYMDERIRDLEEQVKWIHTSGSTERN